MKNCNYLINFDFDEVHTAVLRNAQIYIRKKTTSSKNGERVSVISPFYFKDLFSSADFLYAISPEVLQKFNLSKYKTVLEYMGPQDIINRKLTEYINRLITILPGKIKNRAYFKYYINPRAYKFFIENGLESYCLQNIFSKHKYLRIFDNFDFVTMTIAPYGTYLRKCFTYLAEMISDSFLYEIDLTQSFLAEVKKSSKIFNDFIDFQGPKIVIRTRNFNNKQKSYNSSYPLFHEIVGQLVRAKVKVLNLGCPLLSLNFGSPYYSEINHDLEFGQELALCQIADACIMTAKAGLFSAFAASAITIVRIDEEWSETYFDPPLSLFSSRRLIGLDDIDVRDEIANEDYVGAVVKILKGIKDKNRRRIINKSVLKPKVEFIK